MMYLSFLTRRTDRTTRQLPRMDMRIMYLSFLTRRTERTTRQLPRMGIGILYLSFLTRRTERTTRQLPRIDMRMMKQMERVMSRADTCILLLQLYNFRSFA